MAISLAGFGILLVIAFLGFPLGFSMIIVGFAGFAIIRGTVPALETVSQQILDLALNANFVTLPLFVLMGVFVFRAALAEDIYEAAQSWLGDKRGGLAMTTVAACAGFASISGSSVATAATMAKVSTAARESLRLTSVSRFNCAAKSGDVRKAQDFPA